MKSKWAVYKELELIPDEVMDPRALWPTLQGWGRQFLAVVLNSMSSSKTYQIWKKTDGIGHTWWYVYDPSTQRTHYFSSENEVRVWIESRYYSSEHKPYFYGDNRMWH